MSDEIITDGPPAWPPYPCDGTEQVFERIEIVRPDGTTETIIVASECYAGWYCTLLDTESPEPGFTWRHYVPPPDPEPELPNDPEAEPPADPEE